MSLAWLRHDRALRSLLYWIPAMFYVGAIAAAGHRSAVLESGARWLRHGAGDFAWIALLTWFMLSVYLLFVKLPERAQRLDLVLPLSARGLWLRRTAALLIAQVILLAVGAATLLAGNRLALGDVAIGPDMVSLAVHLIAGQALLIALAQNWRPQMARVAPRAGAILFFVLSWAGIFPAIYFLSARGAAYALIPAAAAAALLVRAYRLLPPAFRFVPQAPPGSGEPTAVIGPAAPAVARVDTPVESGRGGSSRWLRERTLWMSFFHHWLVWILTPVLVILGIMLAGPPTGSRTVTGPLSLFITLLFLMLIFRFGILRSPFLDPLPVERRTIFARLVLPPLAVLFLALGAATILGSFSQHDRLWSQLLAPQKTTPYPNQLLAVAWDGDPPAIAAPWGETHDPWNVEVLPRQDPVLYAPFDAPPGSSREFAAWQVGRAVEASLGPDVPAEAIRHRYLAAAPAGAARWEAWPQLLAPFGHQHLVRRVQTLPLSIALVGAVWFLYLALTIRFFYSRSRRVQTLWGLLSIGIPMILWMLMRIWSVATDYDYAWRLSALSSLALRDLLQLLPGGSLGAWGLCIALLAATYRLAQRQFASIQIPLLYDYRTRGWEP